MARFKEIFTDPGLQMISRLVEPSGFRVTIMVRLSNGV